MKKYTLHAVLKKANKQKVMPALLVNDDEAFMMARDLAWELYMANEGSEELPSYNDLFAEYDSGMGYYSTKAMVDDLYVRTIEDNIEYWYEEVEL